MVILIGLLLAGVVLGAVLGVTVGMPVLAGRKVTAANDERLRLLEDAERSAEAIRREAQVETREEALRLRTEVEHELKDRRAEVIKVEQRVLAKEEAIDRKLTEHERREQGVADREAHLKQLQEDLKTAKDAQVTELERISGLSAVDAKRQLGDVAEQITVAAAVPLLSTVDSTPITQGPSSMTNSTLSPRSPST